MGAIFKNGRFIVTGTVGGQKVTGTSNGAGGFKITTGAKPNQQQTVATYTLPKNNVIVDVGNTPATTPTTEQPVVTHENTTINQGPTTIPNSVDVNRNNTPAPAVQPPVVTETTYIDPNGERKKGYIINDRTYTDPAGTTPVGVGSIVDTAGGQYIKTPEGSMLYSDYLAQKGIAERAIYNPDTGVESTGYIQNGLTYTDPLLSQRIANGTLVDTDAGVYIMTPEGGMLYSDYLQKQTKQSTGSSGGAGGGSGISANEYNSTMAELQGQLAEVDALLEKAKNANNETYSLQLEQLRSQIASQIDWLNEQYHGINRQLYVDYMRSRRDLPQQLAAQGYTGGLRESSLLGLESGYQGQLAENERARLAGIRDIESGRTESELTLGIEKAKAQQQAEEQAYNRTAAIRAAIIEQQNLIEKYRREDEAAATKAAATAASAKPTLSASETRAAIKAGIETPTVLDAYEYYYGEPYQTATPAASAGGSSVKGYDNGTLTSEQVEAAQRAAGLTGSAVDGKWGPQTTAAVGMTAAQYAAQGGGGSVSAAALENELKAIIRAGGGSQDAIDDAIDTANYYVNKGFDFETAKDIAARAIRSW